MPARLLLAILALVAGGCFQIEKPPPISIVLITVDTLRTDHVGAYGGSTSTPAMDRLAREGLLFENAFSPMPETRPAHATLFSSRYPRQHGVVSNALTLPPDVPLITETLRDAGYQTAAFVSTQHVLTSFGLDRGFSVRNEPDTLYRHAHETVPKSLSWLEEQAASVAPFFLWLHVFDPHIPYEPPTAYDRDDEATKRRWPSITWPLLIDVAARNDGDVPAAVLERARSLYASEVEHVDQQLETLLATLDRLGRTDDTLVVLTADHGECFSNGIYFEHSSCLYEDSIAVPLVFRLPGTIPAGERRRDVVELSDVAATVLTLAGLEQPSDFGGRSLLESELTNQQAAYLQYPLYQAREARDRLDLLTKLPSVAGQPTRAIVADRELLGLRTEQWKYLWTERGEELYRLSDDPEELDNLIDREPEVAARLRRQLRQWRDENPMRVLAPETLDPSLRENLRALGYID